MRPMSYLREKVIGIMTPTVEDPKDKKAVKITTELRVVELMKEKGLKMSDLATSLGVDQSNLTKSLKSNPTLSRLQAIADFLGVSVPELFVQPVKESMYGCIYINGSPEPVILRNKEEIKAFLEKL